MCLLIWGGYRVEFGCVAPITTEWKWIGLQGLRLFVKSMVIHNRISWRSSDFESILKWQGDSCRMPTTENILEKEWVQYQYLSIFLEWRKHIDQSAKMMNDQLSNDHSLGLNEYLLSQYSHVLGNCLLVLRKFPRIHRRWPLAQCQNNLEEY